VASTSSLVTCWTASTSTRMHRLYPTGLATLHRQLGKHRCAAHRRALMQLRGYVG
jgi:hypothetical protein